MGKGQLCTEYGYLKPWLEALSVRIRSTGYDTPYDVRTLLVPAGQL